MKRFVFATFLFPIFTFSQSNLPYNVGEQLFYDIYFGPIKVGDGDMKIERQININKIITFQIIGKGKTAPFFDWFFKVRDVYETYLDISHVRPVKFIRDIREGPYKKRRCIYLITKTP